MGQEKLNLLVTVPLVSILADKHCKSMLDHRSQGEARSQDPPVEPGFLGLSRAL